MNLMVRRRLAPLALCALLFAGRARPRAGRDHRRRSPASWSIPRSSPSRAPAWSPLHEPSGTRYEATTRADGRFSLPGLRVGGPYTVTATLSGFQPRPVKGVIVNLGVGDRPRADAWPRWP